MSSCWNSIAGNIGTSIEAARYRQRLQEVLAETQQLNEELQVQQEELKTANEELEEQSRILKESQAHLETQQVELEQTNEQLAEQAQILAEQRDAMDLKNTELNQAQVQLEERAEELQRSSKYKSEFLANMSHELRTPLNSSLILAKLLAENPQENLSAEQVKFAESIYSAGNDLLNLINDILDISKVEAGKLEMRPENTSVARLVDGLRGMFQPLAADKQLDFQVELQAGAPTMIFTDRQRLEQVIKNLLSNAVKFTENGAVSLTRRQPAPATASPLSSAIRASVLPRISRKAFSKPSARPMAPPIAVTAAPAWACRFPRPGALLGGSISVTSEPGQGSVFTLVLPQQYVEPGEEPVEPMRATPVAITPRVTTAVLVPLIAEVDIPRFDDDRARRHSPHAAFWWWKTSRTSPISFTTWRTSWVISAWWRTGATRVTTWPGNSSRRHSAGHASAGSFRADRVARLKEHAETRHIPVHVISVEDRVEAAMHMGAIGYAVKPTTREELKDVFARLEAKLTQKVKRVVAGRRTMTCSATALPG